MLMFDRIPNPDEVGKSDTETSNGHKESTSLNDSTKYEPDNRNPGLNNNGHVTSTTQEMPTMIVKREKITLKV